MEARVASERAGQQVRLAENLEAVAYAEHREARPGSGTNSDITGANRAIAPQRR